MKVRFHNLVAVDCLPDPLVVQLQRFTASLIEQGYADETVQWKVKRVTDFGQWLKQKGVAVADLDEARVKAFLKRQHRERRGDLRTLQQFLDQLRKQNVVPARNLPCDRSPLARHSQPSTKPICAPSAGWSPTRSSNTSLSFVSSSGSASAANRSF